MTEKELFCQEEDLISERLELCAERMKGIVGEAEASPETGFLLFGKELSVLGLLLIETLSKASCGALEKESTESLKKLNAAFYKDIIEDNYETSFANPAFACKKLGKASGRIASAVVSEVRAVISYAYAGIATPVCYALELFLEIYGLLESKADGNALKRALFYYVHDYAGEYTLNRLAEQLTENFTYYRDTIQKERKGSVRHLYLLGEYIGETELQTAAFLDTLSEEEIDSMAETFVGGFFRGFRVMNVSLEGKKYVNLLGYLGFERVTKKVIEKLEKKGMVPCIFPPNRKLLGRRYGRTNGTGSVSPNPQYDYDHRNDLLLITNRRLMQNRIRVTEEAYKVVAANAKAYAGPMLQEIFGQEEPELRNKPEVMVADERLQKLLSEQTMKLSEVSEQYMPSEERSFCIIAYPVPSIGENFTKIFEETVKLNTLDNDTYIRIQQHLCDALNLGQFVEIKGMGENETSLQVALYDIRDRKTESIFENCTADVNIPVGEVFTSPKLTGTNGLLHVSKVYLEGKLFRDLRIRFQDGMIMEYSCANYETEEENATLIRESILYHHTTLPMGEFAIGTNTEAYRMGIELGCQAQLPILIAEKTGPHFAVGDTCYSHAEDHVVYNPDGKEIIARDNELVRNRDKEPDKAYYNCHTDITIPYNELGELTVVTAEKKRIPLIVEGRFVLPGTEELNIPLDKLHQ